MDGLALAQELLRCRSVTPADDGAQAVLAAALERLGFSVTKLRFGAIENFFAERPGAGKHLCFAGHTDVVPPGTGWSHEPFGGIVQDGNACLPGHQPLVAVAGDADPGCAWGT